MNVTGDHEPTKHSPAKSKGERILNKAESVALKFGIKKAIKVHFRLGSGFHPVFIFIDLLWAAPIGTHPAEIPPPRKRREGARPNGNKADMQSQWQVTP